MLRRLKIVKKKLIKNVKVTTNLMANINVCDLGDALTKDTRR